MGGLGNQLFQYAAASTLAKRLQVPLYFDDSELANSIRVYKLDQYEIYGVRLNAMLRHSFHLNRRLTSRGFGSLLKKVGFSPIRFYKENFFGYRKDFHSIESPTWIYGYWQSYRYFAEDAERIRSELLYPKCFDEGVNAALASIRNGVSVGLHIRRGDYLTNRAAHDLHGICDVSYFLSALRVIRENIGFFKAVIFSDDPDWVRTEFIPILELNEIDFLMVSGMNGLRDVDELFLLAQCTHQVISNSTFGWWGAWLNPASSKLVIRPVKWFQSSALDVSDLSPSEWIALH